MPKVSRERQCPKPPEDTRATSISSTAHRVVRLRLRAIEPFRTRSGFREMRRARLLSVIRRREPNPCTHCLGHAASIPCPAIGDATHRTPSNALTGGHSLDGFVAATALLNLRRQGHSV